MGAATHDDTMLGVRARRQVDVNRPLPLIRDLKGLVFDADTEAGDPIAQVRRGALAREAVCAFVCTQSGKCADAMATVGIYEGAPPHRASAVRTHHHTAAKARVGLRQYASLPRPVLKAASVPWRI